VFALKNIKKEKDYVFIDMDGGEFTANGAELLRSGLMLHIEEKRKAKIFIYKEK
jgi:predicted ribosome-associated RNA-binding protein Tma20